MKDMLNPTHLIAALVYSGLGLSVLLGAFVAVDKCTPYDLWQEIIQKQNRALAIVVGATTLGISLIIAASLMG